MHSNYIEMRETVLVIQCQNNLWKIEYRSVAEKWSSFVVVAIFEIYLVVFETVDSCRYFEQRCCCCALHSHK